MEPISLSIIPVILVAIWMLRIIKYFIYAVILYVVYFVMIVAPEHQELNKLELIMKFLGN